MSEIPAIITATAGFVGAIGVVIAAVSKCDKVVAAWNKLKADQHKRALEAKKSVAIQTTASTRIIEEKGGEWRSRNRLYFFTASVVVISFIGLFLQFLSSNPASTSSVAVCVMGGTTIVIMIVVLLSTMILDGISSLLEGQVDIMAITASHAMQTLGLAQVVLQDAAQKPSTQS